MAFSLRKMLSNITYFKKPGESSPETDFQKHSYNIEESTINFESTEPDSTCKLTSSLMLPNTVKNFAAKKNSHSDTDIIPANVEKKQKRKKLKLDINKANEVYRSDSSCNIENTPKHIHLERRSCEAFSERVKGFDFDKSFDLEGLSDDSELELDTFSEHSDTDISLASDNNEAIKMCRKVGLDSASDCLMPSVTPESFGEVEIDKNEEDRLTLLLRYRMKLQKIETLLKKLLSEFQFHIEVSKVFNTRMVPDNVAKIENVAHLDNINRGISPEGNWSFILDKEDCLTKNKVKKQLNCLKNAIDQFVQVYLKTGEERPTKYLSIDNRTSVTIKKVKKPIRINNKKKFKHFDYPDFRDALINLFTDSDYNETSSDDMDNKCECRCHNSITDSGLTKTDESLSTQSITSSIGNFSLDMSTLSAYSESLDQNLSYDFQESLFNTLLQKPAVDRITFYIQVHSVELTADSSDSEMKAIIKFYCPSCKIFENEELSILRHIMSQHHCEKIHFLYKTAYIKKCVADGKEIQPSTVLNPMKMYRDDNKVVCFGDGMYACSLCFENLIVGESILMQHCSEPQHVEHRKMLWEIAE